MHLSCELKAMSYTEPKNFKFAFQIDIAALNNSPDISAMTNLIVDDNECRIADQTDKTMTSMNGGGPGLEVLLDQSPLSKAQAVSGPKIYNANSKTWKRINTGPRLVNPNSEETHAGNKRGAQDHAQD